MSSPFWSRYRGQVLSKEELARERKAYMERLDKKLGDLGSLKDPNWVQGQEYFRRYNALFRGGKKGE